MRGFAITALVAGLLVAAAAALASAAAAPQDGPPQDGAAEADALIATLSDDADGERSAQEEAALLARGFDAFVERMDAFDGERAVALGRAMFDRSPAVWSAFCLEGALRRSAPADLDGDAARAHHAEAERALEGLLASRPGPADRLAIVQRLALLHAGFRRPSAERRALGAALGAGGADGVQIMALKGLSRPRAADAAGPASPETAGALFASLLDRGGASPLGAGADAGPPESAPWALRGLGLAALERALR